jgi:HAD superfamily hydrolase (TIGR01490 family)
MKSVQFILRGILIWSGLIVKQVFPMVGPALFTIIMEGMIILGNIGAFFDIDGTLYREGLITEVFKKLIKYELVDSIRWDIEVKPKYLKWDKRMGDYDDYLLGMIEIYKETIRGLDKNHVEFIAKQVISQKGDRVYTYTRSRLEWHRKNGHKVIAISGSPVEIVREMAKKYALDDYRGSVYVLDGQGKYTGEILPMWDSINKEKALMEMAQKYDIDLDSSYAYGDTAGDFTMFKLVGHPICINPTRELLKKVTSSEIKDTATVIVERKDVIYSIDLDSTEII